MGSFFESLHLDFLLLHRLDVLFVEDLLYGEGVELPAASQVKFALKLHPVKSESVQEGLHQVHKHQDAHSHSEEGVEHKEAIEEGPALQPILETVFEEDL